MIENREIAAMVEELEKLTSKMDVPSHRYASVKWLARNLAIKNANHPDFNKAIGLVKELCKKGL